MSGQEGLLATLERAVIMSEVRRHATLQEAAAELGLGTRTLQNKLRDYGFGPREKPDSAWPDDIERLRTVLGLW